MAQPGLIAAHVLLGGSPHGPAMTMAAASRPYLCTPSGVRFVDGHESEHPVCPPQP